MVFIDRSSVVTLFAPRHRLPARASRLGLHVRSDTRREHAALLSGCYPLTVATVPSALMMMIVSVDALRFPGFVEPEFDCKSSRYRAVSPREPAPHCAPQSRRRRRPVPEGRVELRPGREDRNIIGSPKIKLCSADGSAAASCQAMIVHCVFVIGWGHISAAAARESGLAPAPAAPPRPARGGTPWARRPSAVPPPPPRLPPTSCRGASAHGT